MGTIAQSRSQPYSRGERRDRTFQVGSPAPGRNADDERARRDANAEFLSTQSLVGGGDPTWVMRAANALLNWRKGRQ